jgi:hypothetical protein
VKVGASVGRCLGTRLASGLPSKLEMQPEHVGSAPIGVPKFEPMGRPNRPAL